jgi:hypothetical protein
MADRFEKIVPPLLSNPRPRCPRDCHNDSGATVGSERIESRPGSGPRASGPEQ